MNCNGFLEIDFATYLIVDHHLKMKQYNNLSDIPVAISANTDSMALVLKQEEYVLPEPIAVPNPCDPDNRDSDILVDEVNLNVIRISGMISYSVGIDIVETSENIVLETNIPKLGYCSTLGSYELSYVPLLLVDSPDEVIPEIEISIKNLQVSSVEMNDSGDYSYLITGMFRIDTINEPEIIG